MARQQREHHPGWRPDKLREARKLAGYTQEDLADELGVTPLTVRRHEAGTRWPGPLRTQYCRILGGSEAELGFRAGDGDADLGGPAGVACYQRPAAPPAAQQEAALNIERRKLLGLLGATGLTFTLGPARTPAERLLDLENHTPADGALTVAEAEFEALVADYPTTPPAVLLGRIDAQQQLTDGIRANLALPPGSQARLWQLETVQSGLRGWVANSAGRTAEARVSLAEAYRRADLLGDHRAMAWIRYMQAVVEEYVSRLDWAEKYAKDGLRYVSHSDPLRALILGDPLGRVAAARGDRAAADRQLAEAMSIAKALPAERRGSFQLRTVVHDLTTQHPAMIVECASMTFAALGCPDRAQTYLADHRDDFEGTPHAAYLALNEALGEANKPKGDPAKVAANVRSGLARALPFQAGHVDQRLKMIQTAARRGSGDARELTATIATWRAENLLAKAST